MNFQDILRKYRSDAFNERDKGNRFERLMVNFLKTNRAYESSFSHVWLWMDCPFRKSISQTGKDIGIDLVLRDEEGKYWAVQCKCFKETASIDKRAVDSFIGASGKRFKDDAGRDSTFSYRLWISTTNNWTDEAESELRDQSVHCHIINLGDLEKVKVDWDKLEQGFFGERARPERFTPREDQKEALDTALEHYSKQDRGHMTMACGTGKTFTSLIIAEEMTKGQGLVLFLAPSIALIGQTLWAWYDNAQEYFQAICVCSDKAVSTLRGNAKEDQVYGSPVDLPLPSSTSPDEIEKRLTRGRLKRPERLQVIFSTYQSIDSVAQALKKAKRVVDLIVCDEAHRTTGFSLTKEDESHFVKVHDDAFIRAKKRLYMTATPKIFGEQAKKTAEENSIALCSMDDESLFGAEFYRLGFGKAVDLRLLCDYKVLVLTVNRRDIPEKIQAQAADGKKEIEADDVSKLIGCLNALSKNMAYDNKILSQVDPGQMRRAVAFCQTIKKSEAISDLFTKIEGDWSESLTEEERQRLVTLETRHIDGTMGASLRNERMTWLKEEPENQQICRVLTNVRCLSEGVDVPTLDAVLFLSAKNSPIEVVQSVGRVMRAAKGKKFGYIIIPVIVPSYVQPEDALNDNKAFETVWIVLNALRSHDDRFRGIINKIQLNENRSDGQERILIGGIAKGDLDTNSLDNVMNAIQERGFPTDSRSDEIRLHNAIYARLVKKVGSKQDFMLWANDVAKIADGFKNRITKVVSQEGPHKKEFGNFLDSLRKSLNPSVNSEEAIEMLAQHLITKPVFEALFDNYSFVQNNPVSKSLETMIHVLGDQKLENDTPTLKRLYETVKNEVAGLDNSAAKQKIMVNLYDNFFKIAIPKAVEKLGIVYTPIEVVDFINNSVAKALEKEFGRNISDPNVHIIDPFAGTGTFITRLIQSGLLGSGEKLKNKYLNELHANEIILLAYYIASVNVENAYHEAMGETAKYHPFEGICLTDTFQLYESVRQYAHDGPLLKNTERMVIQKEAPLEVIIGNPPYSIGQRSANDNAQNQTYVFLNKRIDETYANQSSANLLKSLYDTYIKAFRWASDRFEREGRGVVAFVSNAGWLDGNAMDGMRKCLAQEFSKIYILNLRGNQRTSGELSKKEGGKIFGSGSRTPIAITVLIKNQAHHGPAEIYYHAVADNLRREDKLAILATKQNIYSNELAWEAITPNEDGDWLNQGKETFKEFYAIGDKKDQYKSISFFSEYSLGLLTSRDPWCYNFNNKYLAQNIKSSIDYYNSQVSVVDKLKQQKHLENSKIIDDITTIIDFDSKQFSWDHRQKIDVTKSISYLYSKDSMNISLYRPFQKVHSYFNRTLNARVYQLPKLFPTKSHPNLLICVSGIGGTKENSTLISNVITDFNCLDAGTQCFPLYYYEDIKTAPVNKGHALFDNARIVDGYKRHDAITSFILKESRAKYGLNVSKSDIFFFVYGFLHSPDYRTSFSADLKKSLPRLPLVDNPEDFWAFSKAGRDLAELHLNYETVKPYAKAKVTGVDKGNFIVDKLRFASKGDKTTILYNSSITISDIPQEAYDYALNGRSALEWVMDRYQVKTDKDSGIKNDPNDWAKERGQPRYILDLLLSLITVSLETMKIVKDLPKLDF
ncbi:MAG: DEAD/DEAH box helicase family protein [Deltaproteobacteria bacterium]|jgi:predicted helicase|nr:DEAD/DEAH box helicase family protein [Deltaproteobacteria bacterium]